jgi:hypothetical protein
LADPLAIEASAGTVGAALSVSRAIDPQTAIRLSFGTFGFSRQDAYDNLVIDVQANLRLREQFRVQSGGLFLERSIRSPFHVTFGAIANQNRISAVSVPTASSVVIGGVTYSAARAGEIFTDVNWNHVAPYVGFGFGQSNARRRWSLVAEFGAYYEGRAKVAFDSNGAIKANQASFAAYYANLEGQLSRELSPVEVWPTAQLGIRLRM